MGVKKSQKASKEDMILVTEKNRKHMIVRGRVVYHCESIDKKNMVILGTFDIRPRIRKGWNEHGANKFFASAEETYEEWRDAFKSVIDMLIKEKKLFINPKKRLKKYKYDKPKVR